MSSSFFSKQSSITLVDSLLFKVLGISSNAFKLDEEDIVAEATCSESSHRAILENLEDSRVQCALDRIVHTILILFYLLYLLFDSYDNDQVNSSGTTTPSTCCTQYPHTQEDSNIHQSRKKGVVRE